MVNYQTHTQGMLVSVHTIIIVLHSDPKVWHALTVIILILTLQCHVEARVVSRLHVDFIFKGKNCQLLWNVPDVRFKGHLVRGQAKCCSECVVGDCDGIVGATREGDFVDGPSSLGNVGRVRVSLLAYDDNACYRKGEEKVSFRLLVIN